MAKRKRRKARMTVAQKQDIILKSVTAALVCLALVVSLVFAIQADLSLDKFLRPEKATQQEQEVDFGEMTDKSTFLIIGSSDKTKAARFFSLIQVDLETSEISIAALPTSLAMGASTIKDTFASDGAAVVCEQLVAEYGVYPDKYIVLTDSGYKKVVQKLGKTSFTFASDIKYSSDGEDSFSVRIKAGEQELDGASMMALMRYCNEHAKDYRLQNEVMAAAVNQTINQDNVKKGDKLFTSVINYIETDITVSDFNDKKRSLEYMASASFTPSTRLVNITGEETNGVFKVDEQSAKDLKTIYYKEQ